MKKENQLTGGGGFLLILGALAFFLPMFNYQLLILSWLGGMQQPVGLSAMVIGGILFGIGKLQEFRDSSPVASPTDPVANTLQGPPTAPASEPSGPAEGPIA
jgi:hypothetical protein